MQVWEWQKEKEGGIDFPSSVSALFSSILYFLCRDSAFENSPVQRTYKFLDYYVLNDSDLIYNDLFPNSLCLQMYFRDPATLHVFTQEMHVFSNRRSLLTLIDIKGLINSFHAKDIASRGWPFRNATVYLYIFTITKISPSSLCIILNNIWQYNFGKGTCSNLFFSFSKTEITSNYFSICSELHYFLFFTI